MKTQKSNKVIQGIRTAREAGRVYTIADFLVDAEMVASKTEAKRLINQGAVKVHYP